MFCPNCAVKNEDDVKFCRGCGQDISLVLRSVKEHSAIVLASKLDQVFDRPNEGLLIMGILFFFSGVVGILLFVLAFGLFDSRILFLGLPVSHIFIGILTIVQYRRSLSLSSNLSATLSQNTLYCPVCGQLNEKEDKFCSKCGEDLESIRQTMIPVATGRLARGFGLDKENLRKSLEKQGKIAPLIFVIGIIQAFLGLFLLILSALDDFSQSRSDTEKTSIYALFIYFLVSGCAFTIVGWRNMVAEKRRLSALKGQETTSDLETAKLETPTQRQLTPINAEDEIGQINEAETQRELHELKIAESETKPLSQTKN